MVENPEKRAIQLKSYAIFATGAIFVLLSLFAGKTPLSEKLFTFLFDLGMALLSVGLIAYIWDRFGGDPLTVAIANLRKQHSQEVLGIEAVSLRTRDYNYKKWMEYAQDAKEIDMMGTILWRDWMSDPRFREMIRQRAGTKKCKFRFILYKPLSIGLQSEGTNFEANLRDSRILTQSAFDQRLQNEIKLVNAGGTFQLAETANIEKIEERSVDEAVRMSSEIMKTLGHLNEIQKELTTEDKKFFLEVKTNHRTYLTCSVLRFDDRMLVVHYLHRSGRGSPMLEIRGPRTTYFELYREEFERVWTVSETWPPS